MKNLALAVVIACLFFLPVVTAQPIPAQETVYPLTPTVRHLPPPPRPSSEPRKEPRPTRTVIPTFPVRGSPTAGVTPLSFPTPIYLPHPPGEVSIPILMYHHIAETEKPSRYSVSPQEFEKQISSLRDWGYTSISVALLAQAIEQGADLPLRPIVITFDDGYRDVFQNALPVMERYGYTGTVYLISNAIGAGSYMNANQVKELLAKGWEVGSHSKTHANLRKAGASLEEEVVNSRLALEKMFSTPVLTFAYPYGSATPALTRLVRESGYSAGVGVGTSRRHTLKSRYYLSRLEVQGDYDLIKFASLLR